MEVYQYTVNLKIIERLTSKITNSETWETQNTPRGK